MKSKSNWLVIDLNYIFNTYYNKLKSLIKYNLESEIFISSEFIDELTKNIKDKILNLITIYKYIPNNHIIIVTEFIEENSNLNWRNIISNDYKYNNLFDNNNNNNNNNNNIYKSLWKEVFDLRLNNFFYQKDYICFNFMNVEIIDIISIIVKTIETNFLDDIITIISDNNFFYQLINDKVSLLDINLTEETHKILSSNEINLWFQIIKGNKNKNIQPLLFNIFYLKLILDTINYQFEDHSQIIEPKIFINNNEYTELNKNELYIILNNLTEFKKIINSNYNDNNNDDINNNDDSNNIIKDNLYIINEKLLNINLIPNDLFLSIEKSFLLSYNKNNENYFKSNLKIKEKNNKQLNKDFSKFESLKNPFAILEIES